VSGGASVGYLQTGTRAYRRTSLVLFAAGFMAFGMLYVVQGTLPAVSREFGVSAATASLTLSFTTLPLAVGVVLAASWSEGRGRRRLLAGALLGGAVLSLLAAASPGFGVLLVLRMLTGLALAGLPAVAMAYLAEEVEAASLGRAMGLYISGTGLGGMCGRLAGGLVSSAVSWRWALTLVGVLCLAGAVWVARTLPPSRHFTPEAGSMRVRLAALREPVRDPVLLGLSACGFVLMGTIVSLYNYLQYRLTGPPFDLPEPVVALVFLLYVCGTLGSNWMGRLTDRRSRRGVLLLGLGVVAAGVLLTVPDVLLLVLLGTALVTFGFFGAHAVASGWVNAWATRRRAQASALYLFCYQTGSAVVGYVAGLFYGAHGWAGEVGTVGLLLAVAGVVAWRLPGTRGRVEPPPTT